MQILTLVSFKEVTVLFLWCIYDKLIRVFPCDQQYFHTNFADKEKIFEYGAMVCVDRRRRGLTKERNHDAGKRYDAGVLEAE